MKENILQKGLIVTLSRIIFQINPFVKVSFDSLMDEVPGRSFI